MGYRNVKRDGHLFKMRMTAGGGQVEVPGLGSEEASGLLKSYYHIEPPSLETTLHDGKEIWRIEASIGDKGLEKHFGVGRVVFRTSREGADRVRVWLASTQRERHAGREFKKWLKDKKKLTKREATRRAHHVESSKENLGLFNEWINASPSHLRSMVTSYEQILGGRSASTTGVRIGLKEPGLYVAIASEKGWLRQVVGGKNPIMAPVGIRLHTDPKEPPELFVDLNAWIRTATPAGWNGQKVSKAYRTKVTAVEVDLVTSRSISLTVAGLNRSFPVRLTHRGTGAGRAILRGSPGAGSWVGREGARGQPQHYGIVGDHETPSDTPLLVDARCMTARGETPRRTETGRTPG